MLKMLCARRVPDIDNPPDDVSPWWRDPTRSNPHPQLSQNTYRYAGGGEALNIGSPAILHTSDLSGRV